MSPSGSAPSNAGFTTLPPRASLLGLPGELRNAIYAHVFDDIQDTLHLSPLLVCRQIHAEAKGEAYNQMKKCFTFTPLEAPWELNWPPSCSLSTWNLRKRVFDSSLSRFKALYEERQHDIKVLRVHPNVCPTKLIRFWPMKIPTIILIPDKHYFNAAFTERSIIDFISDLSDSVFQRGRAAYRRPGAQVHYTLRLSPELRIDRSKILEIFEKDHDYSSISRDERIWSRGALAHRVRFQSAFWVRFDQWHLYCGHGKARCSLTIEEMV